jgi:hypothetical protein
MRSWFSLLICPFLGGCFGLGYPAISKTPPVEVLADEVRAFRVVSETTFSGGLIAGCIKLSRSVEALRVGDRVVGPESDSYFDYSYILFPFAGSRSRSLEIMLYRPGYEPVSIPARAWWKQCFTYAHEKVVWREAPGLTAQKQAIDQIVGHEFHLRHLSKEVLRFAAQEYARVAETPMAYTRPETREELRKLAKQYNHLAEQETSKQ